MAFGFGKKSQWSRYSRGEFQAAVERAMMPLDSASDAHMPPLAAIDRLADMVARPEDLNFVMSRPDFREALLGNGKETNVDYILRVNYERFASRAGVDAQEQKLFEQCSAAGDNLLIKLGHRKGIIPLAGKTPVQLDISSDDNMLVISKDGHEMSRVPVPGGLDLDNATISINGQVIAQTSTHAPHTHHTVSWRARMDNSQKLNILSPDDDSSPMPPPGGAVRTT